MRTPCLLLAVLAAGCTEPPVEPASPAPSARLTFKMLTREKTRDDCIAGASGCTYARVDYPVITEFADGVAVEAITRVILDAVTSPFIQDGEPFRAPDELVTSFVDAYEDFRAANPQYEFPHFLERKIFVENNSEDVLCLSFSERTFVGGAHGLATLAFRNLDPETGRPVPLSRFLKAGSDETLTQLVETAFRAVRGIEDGVSLDDAGFSFENGALALTDNVAIGEDGLTFYYNVYEIAPYALGATEVFVSYDELGAILEKRPTGAR